MDSAVFLDHLLRASAHCREFTREIVTDTLPTTHAFWVTLNCSYDGNPLTEGETVFPDDVQKHGARVGPLTTEAVVSLLWRDHMVPEWIDISVWEADQQVTYFELLCCGRFTAGSERLYYRWTDIPPFGVKGPVYPARFALWAVKGNRVEKFSLAESRETVSRGRPSSLNSTLTDLPDGHRP